MDNPIEDFVMIDRIIVTHLKKTWPQEKECDVECDCEENGFPMMLWGISASGALCTMCPACREFQWGQTWDGEPYDDN